MQYGCLSGRAESARIEAPALASGTLADSRAEAAAVLTEYSSAQMAEHSPSVTSVAGVTAHVDSTELAVRLAAGEPAA